MPRLLLCAVSHLSGRHGENPLITVWTAWSSAILTRSSPKRLLFVPSSKNCPRRTEVFFKWGGNHLREQFFCREKRRVLFWWVKEMGASLGEVWRVTRRLCRKIKKKIKKKCLASLLGRKLFRPPSYKRLVKKFHRPTECGTTPFSPLSVNIF